MVDPAPFVLSPELRSAIEAMVAAIEAGNQEPRRQFISDHLLLPTSDRRVVEAVLEGMLAAPAHVAANAIRGHSSSTPVPLRHGARYLRFTRQQRRHSIRRI
jgi:hypothetical protein